MILDKRSEKALFLFFLQLAIAFMFLIFSTIAAWYEGSAIIDNPWEWKHSTLFSQLLYGEVQDASQISQIDHFVYASKFQPTFPLIMAISGLYLSLLIGYQFLMRQKRWFVYYLWFLSGVLFLFSSSVAQSPTPGGSIFFYFGLFSSILCIVVSLIVYMKYIMVLRRN